MLESIGMSLVGAIISFLFEQNILKHSTVDIEGAPYWYEKKGNSKRIYISTYADGGMESIDKAKNKVISIITIKIEDAFKVTINKSFSKLSSKKEMLIVQKMACDTNLKTFAIQNTVFQNIKYNEKYHRVFVRGYIDIDRLKKYETKRVIEIKKEVLDYQFDEMMKELDKEAS